MKSKAVIDEIEKSLPVKLRPCRYCRGEPGEYVRQDVNHRGESGFVAKVKCSCCGIFVESFAFDIRSAVVMARSYWEKGTLDA